MTSKIGSRAMTEVEVAIIKAEEAKRATDIECIFGMAGLNKGSRPSSVILSIETLEKIANGYAGALATARRAEIERVADAEAAFALQNELITMAMKRFTERALDAAISLAVAEARADAAAKTAHVKEGVRLREHLVDREGIINRQIAAGITGAKPQ
jgi:hypothetical protein